MKFRSCSGRLVKLLPDQHAYTTIVEAGEGAFCFGSQDWYGGTTCRTIYLHLPYDTNDAHGHHSIHTLRIYQDGEPVPHDPSWLWNGDRVQPTLTPSIACGTPKGCDWHGYLTDGQFKAHE